MTTSPVDLIARKRKKLTGALAAFDGFAGGISRASHSLNV